jgi:hypothetical protein
VEFAAAVLRLVFRSVAEIVAVAPAGAPAPTVSTPAALTLATAVFDVAKLSMASGRACTEPSL